MKKTFMAIVALACAALVISCGSKQVKVVKGNEGKFDSLSYCIGANIGIGINYQLGDIPFNLDSFKDGIKRGLLKNSKSLQEESVTTLRQFFGESLPERRAAHAEALQADSTAVFEPFADEDERHNVSYAIGTDIGTNVANAGFSVQYYWLLKGFQDSFENSTELSQNEVMGYLQHYFMVTRPAEALARGEKWLAKKEKQLGVKKTESGLLYKVVRKGDMERAAKSDNDTVSVHYIGKLQDGTVFDASLFKNRSKEQQEQMIAQRPYLFDEKGNLLEAEEPAKFPLKGVIKGWTEGMKLVGPGGKIKLYIPAELAYGRRGAGQLIGPNEALEFEVELLDVAPYVVEAPATEAAPQE